MSIDTVVPTAPIADPATSAKPTFNPFRPARKRLLGAGPSLVHPRVVEAMTRPQVGHLDPDFVDLMADTQDLLRQVFRTSNPLTMTVSGTGSAGMEATLVNLLEPGDEIVVLVAGYFGARIAEMADRCGAVVHRLDKPWGEIYDLDEVRAALDAHPGTRAVALVHAETSTGADQPLPAIAALCRERGALLLVDTVTSLAGMPLEIDAWGIDAAFSGSQKCLSAPPGLAPVTFGPRAVEKLHGRKTKVRSWYLDLSLLSTYWTTGRRAYHHTAPILNNYAFREALVIALEEGLEARFARHRAANAALVAGMAALGFELHARAGHRLSMLAAFRLPAGLDEMRLRRTLLDEFAIEIGGGLGELAGKVWRVGLMGEGARPEHVRALLAALEELLWREGRLPRIGAGLEAAAPLLA